MQSRRGFGGQAFKLIFFEFQNCRFHCSSLVRLGIVWRLAVPIAGLPRVESDNLAQCRAAGTYSFCQKHYLPDILLDIRPNDLLNPRP